jgi:hypothetical protein
MAIGPHEHRTARIKLIQLGPISLFGLEVSAGADGIGGERDAKILRRLPRGRTPDVVSRS